MQDSLELAKELNNVIDQAVTIAEPEALIWAFEIPIGSQSARAARLLGMATGVIAGTIQEIKRYYMEYGVGSIQIRTVKPSEVKAKVGNKKATKHDIMKYVNDNHNNIGASYPNYKFEHIADAIVIGEIALQKEIDNISELITIEV